MPPKGSNEYNIMLDLIERIEHGIEEANSKLDAHGDRLTRLEMSGQFDAIMALIDDFRKGVTHQLDEIEVKLDAYGDRITRVEIAAEQTAKRIETVECAPAKKRENWKTWVTIIGGLLGVAAVIVPVLIALAKWFDSVKQAIGG